MRSIVMGAALLALAIPAPSYAAPAKAKAKPPAAATAKGAEAKKAPDMDIGQMMAIFDKIFRSPTRPHRGWLSRRPPCRACSPTEPMRG